MRQQVKRLFSGKDKQFNNLSVPVELVHTAVNQETAVLNAAGLDAVSFVQQIHGIHELVEATTQITTQVILHTITTLMMIMNKLSILQFMLYRLLFIHRINRNFVLIYHSVESFF